jgi:hypothetical protein
MVLVVNRCIGSETIGGGRDVGAVRRFEVAGHRGRQASGGGGDRFHGGELMRLDYPKPQALPNAVFFASLILWV